VAFIAAAESPAPAHERLETEVVQAESDDSIAANATATASVFHTEERVAFRLGNRSDDLRYTVHDYWGARVADGSVDPASDMLVVPIDRPGYYQLRLHSDKTTATRTFAIVTPERRDPETTYFGVQGHFSKGISKGYPAHLVPVVDRLGAEHVRGGHSWDVIEREKGRFTYNHHHERMMAGFDRHDLDPLFLLALGNSIYYEQAPGAPEWTGPYTAPHNEAGREAYVRYAREIVTRYPDQIDAVEVWNEYNHETFSRGPAGQDPVAYTRLLEATYRGIKTVRPDVRVVGGAVAQHGIPPHEWTESLVRANALESMDTYSIHPYGISPEGVKTDRPPVHEEMARYRETIGDLPLWITESGTHTGNLGFAGGHGSFGGRSVDEVTQARYLVRRMALARVGGVSRFYHYQLVSNNDRGSGILRGGDDPRGAYAAKPGFVTYGTMARVLENTTVERLAATGARSIADPATGYRAVFRRDEGVSVHLFWTVRGTRVRTLQVNDSVRVVTATGRRQTLHPHDGSIYLTVTPDPVYVIGNVTDVDSGVPVSVRGNVPATGGPTPLTVTTDDASVTPLTVEVDGVTTTLQQPGTATLTLPAGRRPSASTIATIVSHDGQPIGRLLTGADGGTVSAILREEPVFDGLSAYTPGGAGSAMVHDVVRRGGRSCWQTNRSRGVGGTRIAFDVDDRYAYDVDGPMTVALRYYDDGTGTYELRYDAGPNSTWADPGNGIVLEDTHQWRTKRFHLPDASFADRQDYWRDFRIQGATEASDGTELCLGSVTVARGTNTSLTPPTVDPSPAGAGGPPGESGGAPPGNYTNDGPSRGTNAAGPVSPLITVIAVLVGLVARFRGH
jgi:hypothetical protein